MSLPPAVNPQVVLGNAGKFFFGSLCVGTGLLGVWQTQRYYEKINLIAQRKQDLQQSPISFNEWYRTFHNNNNNNNNPQQLQQNIKSDDDVETSLSNLRRINVHGKFRHDCEILVGPRGPPTTTNTSSNGSGGAAGMSIPSSGYYVITPLEIVESTDTTPSMILVNRGWVPRQAISHNHNNRNLRSNNNSNDNNDHQKKQNETNDHHASKYYTDIKGPGHHQDYPFRADKHYQHESVSGSWYRPTGTVQVTVIPATLEEPKFLVAQHTLSTRPAILFWYDIVTMSQLALGSTTSTSSSASSSSTTNAAVVTPPPPTKDGASSSSNHPLLTLVTEIQNDDTTAAAGNAATPPTTTLLLKPTAESVIEGRVHPAVHAGYAVTWYGLCGAGLVLTRRLISRGR